MARVLDEILDAFYARLSELDTVSDATVEELRALLGADRRVKAVDLVAVFERAAREASLDSD